MLAQRRIALRKREPAAEYDHSAWLQCKQNLKCDGSRG
jgi:hypothetical protein